jgi:hypothetical protein
VYIDFITGPHGKVEWSLRTAWRAGFQLRVRECYGDLTYPLQVNAVPIKVENVVEQDYVQILDSDYLQVLDQLYPAAASNFTESSDCSLFTLAFSMLSAGNVSQIWEVFLLPILAQQNLIYKDVVQPLLKTSVLRADYRIVPNIVALAMFLGLTSFVVGVCGILIIYSGSTSVPRRGLFPEFELVCKYLGEGPGNAKSVMLTELCATIRKAKWRTMPERLRNYHVHYGKDDVEQGVMLRRLD